MKEKQLSKQTTSLHTPEPMREFLQPPSKSTPEIAQTNWDK